MGKTPTFGVIRFPGTNCEMDTLHVLNTVMGFKADLLWHQERLPKSYDCLVLPGGFAYGDYLRCGSMAMLSPIMEDVAAQAHRGGLVLGICNGFQVLTEMKLLPGALLRNTSLTFACQDVFMRFENHQGPFSCAARDQQLVRMPIAHGEGCYFNDAAGLAELQKHNQIILRYCDAQGEVTLASNPNGSLQNVAAIANRQGNVMGLMPHPERCSEKLLGNDQGQIIFASIAKYLA